MKLKKCLRCKCIPMSGDMYDGLCNDCREKGYDEWEELK